MKLACILSALLILTTLSCTRTTCDPEDGSQTLQGKWKFKEFYVSPGDGSQHWQPAPQGQTYIEFKANGTVSTDLGLWSSYPNYQYTDSTITLLPASGTNNFLMFYKIEGSRLELSPMCFEGCAYRFKRQ